MAVALDGSSYLYTTAMGLPDEPFTVSFWVLFTAAGEGNDHTLFCGSRATSSPIVDILAYLNGSERRVRGFMHDGYAGVNLYYQQNIIGEWHHVLFTYGAAGDARLSVHGVDQVGELTPPRARMDLTNRITLGARYDGAIRQNAVCTIAEVSVWAASLAPEHSAALADGVSPLLVRPAAMIAYWPLRDAGYRDVVGGRVLTASGTPTLVAGPPVLSPRGPIVGRPTAVTGPALLGFERGRRGVARGIMRGVA